MACGGPHGPRVRTGKEERLRTQLKLTRDGDAFSNAAYARFMEQAAQRLPEDDTLAIMAADARMVTWGPGQRREGTMPQRLLERVLARNPDHGGAIRPSRSA